MLTLEAVAARGLAALDLAIGDGECVALSGPSGSGKTVLLRAIADLDPNSGDAVAGEVRRSAVPAARWRRQVGYLSAEPGWWAERVGDHFVGDPKEVIEALGLPREALDWSVANLSTGERQRLALARPPALALRRDLDAAGAEDVDRLADRLPHRLVIMLGEADEGRGVLLLDERGDLAEDFLGAGCHGRALYYIPWSSANAGRRSAPLPQRARFQRPSSAISQASAWRTIRRAIPPRARRSSRSPGSRARS